MLLPTITDFTTQAHDPARYARLDDDWWVAVADVIASTKLANGGRDRDVNFVAGAVVAVLSACARQPEQPAACQFGGDGATAVVPPGRRAATEQALAALAHWSATELEIPLRVGLVPVAALHAAGHEVLAALHDFGNGNVFGQFIGMGVPMAEHWVKADGRWHVPAMAGDLPGLETLSCRWRPIPPRRGHVLCVIIDPLLEGPAGFAVLAGLQARIEAIVSTALAAPLSDGADLVPVVIPTLHALAVESRTERWWRRPFRIVKAVTGSMILGLVHRLGGKAPGLDVDHYRRKVAERSDYRKQAGGPRMVLDLTEDEAARVETVLAEAEGQGHIRYGTARSDATTMTCMVGDFSADRHVHFVDGDRLGFWRAAEMLKAKRHTPQP